MHLEDSRQYLRRARLAYAIDKREEKYHPLEHEHHGTAENCAYCNIRIAKESLILTYSIVAIHEKIGSDED